VIDLEGELLEGQAAEQGDVDRAELLQRELHGDGLRPVRQAHQHTGPGRDPEAGQAAAERPDELVALREGPRPPTAAQERPVGALRDAPVPELSADRVDGGSR
jgi:hypothetical protein